MSTHKHFDKICYAVLALTLVFTVLLMIASDGIATVKTSAVMGYENKLFDTSYVHSIDIAMDDWDSFTETCTNEEYTVCNLTIDGETYNNVAIRAKGNTSLTQVASYGNNRYSFKIEFDRYDNSYSYYGLDKLCLNNIIQDNTYMKDYLTYRLMGDFSVAAPLCSYANISVNGEQFGLYLAVEGVEESFLERNYGDVDGELYKPDSTSMGGGRGNGKDFEADAVTEETENAQTQSTESDENADSGEVTQNSENFGGMKGDFRQGGGRMGGMQGNPPELPQGDDANMPQNGGAPDMPQNGDMPMMPGNENGEASENTVPDGDSTADNIPTDIPSGADNKDRGNMGGSMGNDDVSLIYTDDDYSSYSNIFDNAKTDITNSDKDRLINSLKNINNNENIEQSVDVEQVIRYFVVHNFVLNFDSYTGSMIHNYYLYESGGKLSMIPWDYNLAFGGFSSAGGAQNLINYPIDEPVSGGTVESRPMLAWIFSNDEYTEMYHELFAEFIEDVFDSGRFEAMITETVQMISPYVESDPTKFCTYDEFVTGAETLKKFCLLRAESISGQLDGTIGSTSEAQTNSESLISADGINISDMGSMNNSMGGRNTQKTQTSESEDADANNTEQFNPTQGKIAPTDGGRGENAGQNTETVTAVTVTVVITVAVLVIGLLTALFYKRKK